VFKLYNGDPSTVAAAKAYLGIPSSTSNSSSGKPTSNDQISLPIDFANTFSSAVEPATSNSISISGSNVKGRLLQFLTSY
jgi:hypothetical protein